MIGDILLIKSFHRRAAERIWKAISNQNLHKRVISISGESGSGKSELAHSLARVMNNHGVVTKILHSDNFYNIDPLERTAFRVSKGIAQTVGLQEYDWKAAYAMIRDFKENKTSSFPCIDLLTQQTDTQLTDFSPVEVLIFEGLYAIHIDTPGAIKILIDITYEETRKAQLLRGKEHLNEVRFQVLQAEHKAVLTIKSEAQIIINKKFQVQLPKMLPI